MMKSLCNSTIGKTRNLKDQIGEKERKKNQKKKTVFYPKNRYGEKKNRSATGVGRKTQNQKKKKTSVTREMKITGIPFFLSAESHNDHHFEMMMNIKIRRRRKKIHSSIIIIL